MGTVARIVIGLFINLSVMNIEDFAFIFMGLLILIILYILIGKYL